MGLISTVDLIRDEELGFDLGFNELIDGGD